MRFVIRACLEANSSDTRRHVDDQLDVFYVAENGGTVNVLWVGSDGRWRGPSLPLGSSVQALQATPVPMSPNDFLAALAAVNVSSSIEPVSDMLGWLADPVDTPYPALAHAMLTVLHGRKSLAPAFIDVVRSFYEDDLHQPRRERSPTCTPTICRPRS